MERTRYESLKEVFLAACEVAPPRRAEFLEQACGSDIPLKLEVEQLLQAHAESPASAARLPAVAERIGRYRILGILGAGGMGTVYEAEQDSPRRLVALKVLRGLPLFDDLTPRLFQREGQALARLEHPGIAAIHEAGRTDDGLYFLAMERVRGIPLTEYFRKVEESTSRKVEIRERLELFVKLCDAVHYAHQRGVIHRDLKPSNILVAEGDPAGLRTEDSGLSQGRPTATPHSLLSPQHSALPKVLDFGLARITDPAGESLTRITQPGRLQGTLAYMSPEQARGEAESIDLRSDIYALGVILYEMLAGGLPYDLSGVPLAAAVRIICEQSPKPLRAAGVTPALLRVRGRSPSPKSAGVNPAARFDADLETIVFKALEKDPARRYASVAQLGSDIAHYLRNEPITARPASALYQFRKLVSRHRAIFSLAIGSFVVVCGLAVYAFWQGARATEERDQAVAARRSAEEVAGFLESLFTQGNPNRRETADPKVRDLLEAGVARLDSLTDQPLIYAQLADVLGGVYTVLADLPRARGLLEKAVSIRESELGDAHPDVASSLIKLAWCAGDHDRAHQLLARALEIRRAYYGEPHELVAAALEQVGTQLFYSGDYASAEAYLQQSLDMRSALGPGDLMETAMALHNLGYALQALGRLDDAERNLLSALDMKRRVARAGVQDDALSVGLSFEALAHVRYDRGDFQGAERYLFQQVEAYRQGLHPGHPKIAWGLKNYAFLVDTNQGPARAEPIFREALAIEVAAYGDQHPDVAKTLNHLAQMRLAQDDPWEALELNSKCLAIRRAQLGEDHDWVAGTLHDQGQAYRRAGMFEDAEAALLEGHAILARNHGEDCKQSRAIVQALIALYDETGDCDPADDWRATLARIRSGP